MYIVRPSPARVKRNPQKPGFSRRKELGPRMQSASGGQYPMHNGTDRESLVCLGKHLALPPPTFSRHSPPARCRSHAIHNTIPLKALDLSMKHNHSRAEPPRARTPPALCSDGLSSAQRLLADRPDHKDSHLSTQEHILPVVPSLHDVMRYVPNYHSRQSRHNNILPIIPLNVN